MKLQVKMLFVMLFLINIVSNNSLKSSVKSKQINYQENFEQCQQDYEKMYEIMNKKILYYTQNEAKLLESVRKTVLKVYEKNDKLRDEKMSELEKKYAELETKYNEKMKELINEKMMSEKKLKELKDKMQLSKTDYLQIDSSYKALMNDKKDYSEKLKKCNEDISKLRSECSKKEIAINNNLEECRDSFKKLSLQRNDVEKELSRCRSHIKGKSKVIFESFKEILEEKIIKSKNENKENLQNQLVRGKKINENLDLVADKIKTLLNFKNDFNLTNSTVQIQIIFMDKNNKTQSEGKLNNSTYKNNTYTNSTSPLQELEMHRKIQIGTEVNPIKKSILIPMRFKEKSSNFFTFDDSYSHKLSSLSKNQLTIMKLEKEENNLNKKLDYTLFQNISKSKILSEEARKIFLFLNEVQSKLYRSEEEKFYCEKKLVTLTNNNLMLKEALAEMEVKYRTKKFK